MKQKVQRESREIKGEVESYSKGITPFPGDRGSRGIKVEGRWHNIIGFRDYLENLDINFPIGSYVKFMEVKNMKDKKEFWDVPEGTSLETISKKEAFVKDVQIPMPVPEKPAPVEEIEAIEQDLKRPIPIDARTFDEKVKRREELHKQLEEEKIQDEKKYFEETGQAFFELTREDIISMSNKFLLDPGLKKIELPFNPKNNAALQLKATLIVTIVTGLGPKIILEVDKSHPDAVHQILLLLLGEMQIAEELVKEKIMQHKKNIIIEADKK